MESYNVWPFVYSFFHLAQCFQGLAMVQHVSVCNSFSQLNEISLYGETSFCLPLHLLMGIGLSHLYTPLFFFHCPLLPPSSVISISVGGTNTDPVIQAPNLAVILDSSLSLRPTLPLTSKPSASPLISYRLCQYAAYFTPSAATTQSKLLFLWHN